MKTKGETMKWLDTRLFCTIVCLGSLPLSAPAAEADAAAQPPARVSPDAAARDREIAIELSEEPLEMELFRPDPELLKQQFAAVVEVFIPSHTDRRIPDRLRELAVFRGQSLLYFGSIQMSFGSQDDRPMTPADSFQRLVQEAGNSSDEGGEGLAFLLSEAVNEGYLSSGLSSPAELHGISGGYYEFRILAPSADHARERAEALARLLDRAIAVPLQQELRMQREQQEETIELLRKQLAEAQQRAEQTEEQYQKVAETAVGRDELNQLKTERRLLDVELAGIRARIETAEEILAKLKELQKAGRPAEARACRLFVAL
jgi:hypothetical protein